MTTNGIPEEGEKLLCKSVVAGPGQRGSHDGYGILWEVKDGPFKGLQLETFTFLNDEGFEKGMKRLGSVGVRDIVTDQPTRDAYVTVKHREYNGKVTCAGKYFDAVRVGGTVDPDLAKRLVHRARLLKAGQPITPMEVAPPLDLPADDFGGGVDDSIPF